MGWRPSCSGSKIWFPSWPPDCWTSWHDFGNPFTISLNEYKPRLEIYRLWYLKTSSQQQPNSIHVRWIYFLNFNTLPKILWADNKTQSNLARTHHVLHWGTLPKSDEELIHNFSVFYLFFDYCDFSLPLLTLVNCWRFWNVCYYDYGWLWMWSNQFGVCRFNENCNSYCFNTVCRLEWLAFYISNSNLFIHAGYNKNAWKQWHVSTFCLGGTSMVNAWFLYLRMAMWPDGAASSGDNFTGERASFQSEYAFTYHRVQNAS